MVNIETNDLQYEDMSHLTRESKSIEHLKAEINITYKYLQNSLFNNSALRKLFDEKFYVEQYPDVKEAGIDPFYHYMKYGAAELRNPNSWFSTSKYLDSHPDIRNLDVNPLIHYFVSCGGVPKNQASYKFYTHRQENSDACAEKIRHRLASQSIIRQTTTLINPDDTIVVCGKDALIEAATHYRIMLGKRMPDFLLLDWDGSSVPELADLATQLQCKIFPHTSRDDFKSQKFCLYGQVDKSGWKLPASFMRMEDLYRKLGFPARHFVEHRTVAALRWQPIANDVYVDEHWHNIVDIYKHLADEE